MGEVAWATLGGGELPHRDGPRPEVSWTIPQQQSQNAPAHLQELLYDEVRTLSGVDVGPSRISVSGPHGFTVRDGSDHERTCGPVPGYPLAS